MQTERIEKRPLRRFAVQSDAALDQHPVLFVLALAFAVTLAVEMASRHSLWQGIMFLFAHPIHIAANMTIILVTLAAGLFFRKRVFFIAFFTVFWLGLGVTNAIVLLFRVTPFGAIDIALLPSVSTVITVYLDLWQILLIIVMFALIVSALTITFFKSPKSAPSYRSAALVLLTSTAAAM